MDTASADAVLVLNEAGNLRCPQCQGGVTLRIQIPDQALMAFDFSQDAELFTLRDIMVACFKCPFRTPLQTFVVDHLLVHPVKKDDER